MENELPVFSDYIVFVDESGSPTMRAIDPNHPVFVLVFCIVNKWEYCDVIQPAIKRLKFQFFGHDMTVLHSREIRKRQREFDILMDEERRRRFLKSLDDIVRNSKFDVIATVIDKRDVWDDQSAVNPDFLYHHALWECIKKLRHFLREKGEADKLTHIIAESRGKIEDRNLVRAFDAISYAIDFSDGHSDINVKQHTDHLSLLFAEKKINSAGLQLADLVGHPLGRHAIAPDQPNQAFEAIKDKIVDDIWPFFLP
jgi:hypothetical protein